MTKKFDVNVDATVQVKAETEREARKLAKQLVKNQLDAENHEKVKDKIFVTKTVAEEYTGEIG